jgi:hypothetical protein
MLVAAARMSPAQRIVLYRIQPIQNNAEARYQDIQNLMRPSIFPVWPTLILSEYERR